MEVETSTKTSSFGNRPKIRPGFYAAVLREVKTKNKEGKLFEKADPKFQSVTNYAILEFQIFKIEASDTMKPEDDVVKGPVTTTEGNKTTDVFLSQFFNWRYTKRGPNNEPIVSSGFGPASKATNIYKALGWAGPEEGKKLDLDAYTGKWATVIVDDYTKTTLTDEETFSVIKEVKPFKGKVPTELSAKPSNGEPRKSAMDPHDIEEYLTKVQKAKDQVDQGLLTVRGFDIMLEALKREYGVD